MPQSRPFTSFRTAYDGCSWQFYAGYSGELDSSASLCSTSVCLMMMMMTIIIIMAVMVMVMVATTTTRASKQAGSYDSNLDDPPMEQPSSNAM